MSARQARISVVIPAFQAAATIRDAVRSAVGQTHRPLEIIVVDDGSTDETAAIAQREGPPVRCIRQANAGDLIARNRGAAEARGDLVAFLDADDLWVEQKLKRQIRALDEDGTAGAAQCGALFVDDELRPVEVRRGLPGLLDLDDALRFRGLPALSSAVVIRRDCLERIGPLDPSVRGKDEWDLALRLVRSCGLLNVPEPLVLRRVHASSASRGAAYAERQIAPGLEILRRTFADPALPPAVRMRRGAAYAAFYSMIAGSFLAARRPDRALLWSLRAALTHPGEIGHIVGTPVRSLRRALQRRTLARDRS